jgi:putative heme iron utilization protein
MPRVTSDPAEFTPMKTTTLGALLATGICALTFGPARADSESYCATREQAQSVAKLYEQTPPPAPFMAAPKLGIPEAAVSSALAPAHSVGAPASDFFRIWESLRQWDDALTLVLKGGQVFEIHGRIHGGEPSKISKNYNLSDEGAGFSGHIRPDLMSVIYAIDLPGREGPVRGVAFYDQKGESAFWVLVPPTGATAKNVAQFEATRELMRTLARPCPVPESAPH